MYIYVTNIPSTKLRKDNLVEEYNVLLDYR